MVVVEVVMLMLGKRVMLAVCEAGMEVMTPLMAAVTMWVSFTGGHMMDVAVVFSFGILDVGFVPGVVVDVWVVPVWVDGVECSCS